MHLAVSRSFPPHAKPATFFTRTRIFRVSSLYAPMMSENAATFLILLDRKGFQFFDFNMAIFRKRDHHRGDTLTAFVVCFVYA